MNWYRSFWYKVDHLKPVPKYVAYALGFFTMGLLINLIWGPVNWGSILAWTVVGASQAFWSERARNHPQPPPPVTRYTNPHLLDENGRYKTP
jgi:hypothetical protein